MNIIPYIGVVFPFMESLLLDRYHFYFLTILKAMLRFLLLLNSVLHSADALLHRMVMLDGYPSVAEAVYPPDVDEAEGFQSTGLVELDGHVYTLVNQTGYKLMRISSE